MSIWSRIADALAALAQGQSLSEIFEKLRAPPERSVGFAIAVISLGAKMAKADGEVSLAEVRAFREIFHIAPEDEAAAARVFNLARQDVAGFELYATRIARMFSDAPHVLENLLEGLFHISMADGAYHAAEAAFLEEVARRFAIPDPIFKSLRARYVPDAEADPYTVLGLDPGTDLETARDRWRTLVRETHPDVMMARGLPEEAVKLATHRLTAINAAWEAISTGAPS